MARIVIDPGHGGQETAGHSSAYGGRGPRGTLEKDVTLAIARRAAEYLGPDAVLTRNGDFNVSLGARAQTARDQRADVFVSVHANHGAPHARGTETFVHANASAESRALGHAIHSELATFGAPQRGVAAETLGVLTPQHHLPTTASCLVEVDYLSSAEGEMRLTDPSQVDRLGQAIARGVQRYLGVRQSKQSKPSKPSKQSSRFGGYSGYGGDPKRRALVAGINDYSLTTAATLSGCIPDLDSMKDTLSRYYGFEVSELRDQAATKRALLAKLTELADASQTGDALVFFYSGHGATDTAPGSDPNRFRQSLYPADGDKIYDSDLAALVRDHVGEGVSFTIILDSCFSGGMGDVVGVPDVRRRGLPLPQSLSSLPSGTTVALEPVGICRDPSGSGWTQAATISNVGLVCEPHPNTVTVPVARAVLFTAVDFGELSNDSSSGGTYTKALANVISGGETYLSNSEIQRRVVEALATIDATMNPMLRCQQTRLESKFCQAYTSNPVPEQQALREASATW